MNRYKADVLDHFVSAKASRDARAALRDDPVYRELKSRLDAIGFFAPAPWDYAWRVALALAIGAAGWAAIVAGAWWTVALGVIAVGIAMVQWSFLAHDAGHGALAKRPWLVELVGQTHSSLLSGFSFTYFRRSHDLHHFHTNEQELDPDCLSDLFSVEAWSAERKTGIGRWMTRYQAVLMPLLFPMWALAMKWDGLCFLARHPARCWRDVTAIALHVALWLVVPIAIAGPVVGIVAYLGANAIAGIYLGVVTPMNHQATTYLGAAHTLSFVEHQLATCRNIRSPARPIGWLFDYLFVGLNRQIEHHLFPWAPVSRLPAGARVVRALCRERGLPYNEMSYRAAVAELVHHFARVGRMTSRDARWRLSSESPRV